MHISDIGEGYYELKASTLAPESGLTIRSLSILHNKFDLDFWRRLIQGLIEQLKRIVVGENEYLLSFVDKSDTNVL